MGSIFKDPKLLVRYDKVIVSKYDFYDEATRFYYEMLNLMYKTFSQTFTESEINMFASQEENRLKLFRKFNGYKTLKSWGEISDVANTKKYYENIKKYSLVREYGRQGYPVQSILNYKRFNEMKAEDIYRVIRTKADKIHTIISGVESGAILTSGNQKNVRDHLITPDIGLPLPWKILNSSLRGCRLGKVAFNGFLSNEGKTRNLMLICCYTTLVLKEKFLLMSNEMDEKDLKNCLITTVVNNECFRPYHGIELSKPEKEIVEGIYHDDNGNVIQRKEDSNGNFLETEDEYVQRVERSSSEYRKIMAVSKWIDEQSEGTLFFEDMGSDYSDSALEFKIREYRMVHGVRYCGYDTMKGFGVDDWQTLKQTATRLKELMKELGMFCWAVFQLTDDTIYTDIFDMSSNNISNSKQIKHVADSLLLGKRINKEDYGKYQYISSDSWGTPIATNLNSNKNYFAIKFDKNRSGNKDFISLFEIDLDRNIWKEDGYLIRRKGR